MHVCGRALPSAYACCALTTLGMQMTRNVQTRSYWAGEAGAFIQESSSVILGQLSKRVNLEHAGNEKQQIRAWERSIKLLKTVIASIGEDASGWGVLLEMPLLRLGRRIDSIILVRNHVVCIEFKIGSTKYHKSDIDQTVDYALCLRDFHEGSRDRCITPVLCADEAEEVREIADLRYIEHVASCVLANGNQVASVLLRVSQNANNKQIDWREFDASRYNPTPSIVAAARAIYAGHAVQEIGRADASAKRLSNTAQKLEEIVSAAKRRKQHAICFVTGDPGSGKTLLGLDLVLAKEAGRVFGEPAALLSGNRPLVHVLQEAIVQDARDRFGAKVSDVRREAQQALQTLLGYLKEYSQRQAIPAEHVVVFDEAQRAWDSNTGMKLMGRQKSEPQLFLEILGRLPWACLICLVGAGQEINRGEGGLAIWGEALAELRGKWLIHASTRALKEKSGGLGLSTLIEAKESAALANDRLHLSSNIRAYRNPNHGNWVEALLSGKLQFAGKIASSMEHPPAYVTRDFRALKDWLLKRRRGGHRVGLLASSGAVRLLADGVPPSPRSNQLSAVAHWFLKPDDDFRSSNALEIPLSEFVCQGLEIDYVGLLWGNDLVWSGNGMHEYWIPREMRAPKWRIRKTPHGAQNRVNAYRVLLTRARAGLGIFVPRGNTSDRTREPLDFELIFKVLCQAGCKPIGSGVLSQAGRNPT